MISACLAPTQYSAYSDPSTQLVEYILFKLDYLSRDYRQAIREDGAVLSWDEYEEMKGIAVNARLMFDSSRAISSKTSLAKFRLLIDILVDLISEKKSPVLVEEFVKMIQRESSRHFRIASKPVSEPNLSNGNQLFQVACSKCHGVKGKSDSLLASQLSQTPRDLTDSKFQEKISVYQLYQVITYGIEDSPMPSFVVLPSKDRWDLAAYVKTLAEDKTKKIAVREKSR